MRLIVVGAGAMGTFIAGKLKYHAPATVIGLLTSRPPFCETLLSHGIKIASAKQTLAISTSKTDPVKLMIFSSISDVYSSLNESINPTGNKGFFDLAIIMTKGMEETRTATLAAISLLQNHGCMLSLQNGIGYAEIIRTLVNQSEKCLRTYIGTTSMGIRLEQITGNPVVLYQSSLLGATVVADDDIDENGVITIQDIETLLKLCDMDVIIKPKSARESVLWNKLVVSATLNPLSVILNKHNGAIFEATDGRVISLLGSAVAEVMHVAQSKGIDLDFSASFAALARDAKLSVLVSSSIERVDKVAMSSINQIPGSLAAIKHVLWVAYSTYNNINSMLADVRASRKTEFSAIILPIILEANRLKIPCPTLQYFASVIGEIA